MGLAGLNGKWVPSPWGGISSAPRKLGTLTSKNLVTFLASDSKALCSPAGLPYGKDLRLISTFSGGTNLPLQSSGSHALGAYAFVAGTHLYMAPQGNNPPLAEGHTPLSPLPEDRALLPHTSLLSWVHSHASSSPSANTFADC